MKLFAPLVVLLALTSTAAAQSTRPVAWDTYADTWVATDGLGRRLPTFADVGPPKANKTVLMFYYLWQDDHSGVVRDMAKVLAADPDAHVKVVPDDWYHWGEPLLGYYLLTDPAVLRAHASMLTAAGVDAVVFDSSNGYTHKPQYTALCDTYEAIRATGQSTPQIAHLLHANVAKTTRTLYDDFYSKKLYPDLWFRWDGKPLLMTVPAQTPPELAGFFTQRWSWAWHRPKGWFGDGRDRWPWLDDFPQAIGWHASPDGAEEVSVCAAQHPSSAIGRSFHGGHEPAPADRTPAAGLFYAEQWRRALDVSPPVLFLTNFNEWIAKGYLDDHPGKKPRNFLGHDMGRGEAFFVDEYDPEFSRDLEPAAPTVANRGVADNYYYQTVANVRRYKGVRPLPAVSPRPITIDGHFDDWHDVGPEFRDPIGDPVHRDAAGFDKGSRYVNQTGRNDIVAAKVSCEATAVYFYVRTLGPLSPPTDDDWMALYLDVDHDARTGWMGYDFAIRQHGPGGHATLERCDGARFVPVPSVDVRYALAGREMEIALPRAALGNPLVIDFKWADHCYGKGDWTDFTLNGDAAPDFRFNYRAQLPPEAADRRP